MMFSGKGDPLGFMHYCKRKLATDSDADHNDGVNDLFMRYVGNRRHVFFHLAGAAYAYHEWLYDWMENDSGASKSLRDGPIADLKNPKILTPLRILGIIGKYITAPWMRYVYSNKKSMTHLELSSSLFPACFTNVTSAIADPQLMLGDDNVFGVHYTAFNDDSVLQRLHQDGTFNETEKKS